MANYLYNNIELPQIPASTSPVAVISSVLESASSMFGGASYIVTFGASILWNGGKCYVSNISGVYRYDGSAWVWHYGSGTTYTQDIIASGYFDAVWTNTNIPTADGVNVYLAATEPVPVGGDSGGGSGGEEEETPETPEYTIDDVIKARREGFITGLLTGLSIKGVLNKKTITEPSTALYYLYGTPSESGNVAIADGEGYVRYEGEVLPKLPESDLPYMLMWHLKANVGGAKLNFCRLYALPSLEYYKADNGNWCVRLPIGGLTCQIIAHGKDDFSASEWEEFEELTTAGGFVVSDIMWANFNVLNEEGTIALPATAPIPLASSEPVAAVYGGYKLPVLPEYDTGAYPYSCMEMRINAYGEHVFDYSASPNPINCQGDYCYAGGRPLICMCRPDSEENSARVWSDLKEDFALSARFDELIWTSHDISYTEEYGGGLARSADPAPIPVYEQKE